MLRGWTLDRANQDTPPTVHIIVDGQEIAAVMCDIERLDVVAAGLSYSCLGFQLTLPAALEDDQPHKLAVRDWQRKEVPIALNGDHFSSIDFTWFWRPEVRSCVDGLRYGAFEGWAMRTSRDDSALQGNAMIRITCDGATIGHIRANGHRGDVGRAVGGPSNCGFRFTPPSHIRSGHPRQFGFFLMPENIELQNSPIQTSLVDDEAQKRLLDLVSAVDQMHRDLTRIRRQLHEIAPKPRYTIAEYDRWFRLYEPALRRRVAAARPADGWKDGPLVSVLCPVYRPALEDFHAAVESVLTQTYKNFELILVDDNSRDPALSEYMAKVAALDTRVRVLRNKKNLRISGATNVALKAARGAWIAFFDHDDLLVDVALECMLMAAQSTGARLLYSDEDKLDQGSTLIIPAFKPDWNHRLMLGVNYVCHLLFVQKSLTDEAGLLDSVYDGAQDHEYILRLSEHLQPAQIHHVPEVLYHWRITPGSTAETIANKGYAVEAGRQAVSDHLVRIGRPAVVEVMDEQTLFRQRWPVQGKPTVSIIIPYKDQIETTRRCLDAVLAHTSYPAFDVILVDNWSTSEEAIAFAAQVARMPNARILRIEEEFNFSRINNLAAASSNADFFVFMNNDLFVSDAGWLDAVLGEAMDPSVGAVGGKFFYPDGGIQHAGVVTGIGGVAGHVHVGLKDGDNGFGGRLLFAQEMSAVTAAGVLVRASAFREVGGFDEMALKVAFNDIDLCLKLRAAGYKVIWSPDFVAEHHESLSRGDDERPMQENRFFDEIEVMKARYGSLLEKDPFYHRVFALGRQAFFDLREPDDLE